MDTEFLKEVEKFTNLKSAIDTKKRNAFEKAQNKLIFALDGGLFKANPETIMFAKSYDSNRDLILIDTNNTPIKVQNKDEFVMKAESCYYEAMNEYHALYNNLKQQRSVSKVMNNE